MEQDQQQEKAKRNFNLVDFKKANETMIGINDKAFRENWGDYYIQYPIRAEIYTKEKIEEIVKSNSLSDKQRLSRYFFNTQGIYKEILIHYATLLKYLGLLIPCPAYGQDLSNKAHQKRYFNAMSYVDNLKLTDFLTNCAVNAVRDGTYYGLILRVDKSTFSYVDLPLHFCRSNYKDDLGNNLVEFDLSYFDTFEENRRKKLLSTYPKYITKAYNKFQKDSSKKWTFLPSSDSICFNFFDGSPAFLDVILACLEYEESFGLERERSLEEIRKIIVQKIPHDKMELVFEPEEAKEMHEGSVKMLKGNKNISVLTTYADVEAILAKTSSDKTSDLLGTSKDNIYLRAGVSQELFNATTSMTLSSSIKNDIALMMTLANKFSIFMTNLVNRVFGNSNLSFTYKILPISYHNDNEFLDSSLKLATAGYSLLLPSLCLGINQSELLNIKNLENDVLKLTDILIPPALAYTQSGAEDNKGGKPPKKEEETNPKTEENKNSQ